MESQGFSGFDFAFGARYGKLSPILPCWEELSVERIKSAAGVWCVLRENRDKVLAALTEGRFVALHLSTWGFLDKFAAFLEHVGFFVSLEAFGDQRDSPSIHPFFFMLVMTFKTLLGYDSFNILPVTLFRSAALLRLMGFNAIQIKQGFNQKGTVRPFDPDTLSQFLQTRTQTHYLLWLTDLVSLLRRRHLLTGTFLLDCIYITVKSDHYEKMGRERDKDDGHVLRKGYKVACLVNLLPDHTLVTVGLMVFPLTVPDLICGKVLIRHILRTQRIGFIKNLVMDMGFLDGAWLHDLKTRDHIDVFIPVKENMNILADAIGLARYERVAWETVRQSPRREIALLCGLTTWDSTKLPLNCCLVRDTAADGTVTYWAIVTPKAVTTARAIYDVYSDRWDLEEAFNELTCLWAYDRFYSTKWSLVLAQVFFTFIVYSLVSLYKTEKGGEIAEMGIKRLRAEHFRSDDEVVVYLDDCYAIFTVQEFMILVLENLDAFGQNKQELLAVLRGGSG